MIMLHIHKKPEVERKQEVKVTGTNKDDSGPKKPVQRKNKKVQPNDPAHAAVLSGRTSDRV